MSGEPRLNLVRLTTASNPFEAHLWQQALEGEGIPCQVLGDYLDTGLGNLPGMMAELWVEADDAEKAQAILRQHQEHLAKADSPEENEV